MHLSLEVYQHLLDDRLSATTIAEVAHAHTLELCPTCRSEWERAAARTGTTSPFGPPPGVADPVAAPAADADAWCRADDADRRKLLSRLRLARRRAREDVELLLALPPADRADRIARSRTRLSSRAVADLMIEEGRARLFGSPHEAASLASLVPAVLEQSLGGGGTNPEPPWLRSTSWRAQALRARALDLGGRREAGRALLARLRTAIGDEVVDDLATLAELACAEASLGPEGREGPDRGRDGAEEAGSDEIWQRAASLYRQAGDEEGVATVLLARAGRMIAGGIPRAALELCNEALELLGSDGSSHLVKSALELRTSCAKLPAEPPAERNEKRPPRGVRSGR